MASPAAPTPAAGGVPPAGTAAAAATDVTDGADVAHDAPAVVMEQSPLDDRHYRMVSLPNDLRVLLVADDLADHAAACLNVAVGSMSDPPELPGLAHFTEHMLFLGTVKYPDEASYVAHIKAHGGTRNASTGVENTSYYFSVVVDKTGATGAGDGASLGGGAPASGTVAADASARNASAGNAPAEGAPAGDAPAGDGSSPVESARRMSVPPPPTVPPVGEAADMPVPTASSAAAAEVNGGTLADAGGAGAPPFFPMPAGLAPYHEALDRFAQFFISPLFTPSATEREVRAVDSEFRNCILDDVNRRAEVRKAAAVPGHPVRNFAFGNASSLWDGPTAAGVDVRGALLAFHKKHYSANRMTLVLVAPAPLDTLAAWADTLFGPIPNTRAPPAADAYAGLPPYGSAETGRLLRVVPIKEYRWLSLHWVLPPFGPVFRTDPAGFIARRFNYAGPGSLLSALRTRGWVSSLRASTYESNKHWQTMQVWADLTRAGAAPAATDEIIQSIFAYLRLLAAEGVTRRAYQDAADVTRLFWMYKDREEPSSLAQTLARRMHVLPDKFVLSGESYYREYDEVLIVETLRLLSPAAALVTVMDPSFEGMTDCVEKWYGTAYSNTAIPDATLSTWATAPPWPELSVGPLNVFIPTDLTLVCDTLDGAALYVEGTTSPCLPQPEGVEVHSAAAPARVSGTMPSATCLNCLRHADDGAISAAPPVWDTPLLGPVVLPADATVSAHPVLLRDDPSVRLHYQLDRVFRRPKAYVCIQLVSPAVYASGARSRVLAELAAHMLGDDLTEATADAAEAGLHAAIDSSFSGFYLSISGYTHKLPLLLETVIGRLARFRADPARFARVAEVVRRSFRNLLKGKPLQHASRTVSMLTLTPVIHLSDILRVFGDGPAGASSEPPLEQADGRGEAPVLSPTVSPPTPAEVESFVASLWPRGLFVEALVMGNVSPEGALALAAIVRAALPSPPLPVLEAPVLRVIQLPARQTVVARIASPKPEDTNSGVRVLYQLGLAGDPVADVTLRLLARMLSDRVFTVLRTEQQLGYSVYSWSQQWAGVNVLCVSVQSPSASPETVAARIQACLDDFGATTLPSMDVAPFKTALAAALREPDKQLWSATARYLNEIFDHTYDWGRREALAAALARVDTAALCRLWATYMAADAPERRVLVSAVHPPQHPPALSPAAERAAVGGGGGGGSRGGGGGGGGGGSGGLPPIVLPDVAAHPGAVRAWRNSRPLYPVYGYVGVGDARTARA